MSHAVRWHCMPQLVERCLESGSQFLGVPSPPVVEEDYERVLLRHVVVNCNYIESVLTKCLQYRGQLTLEHGDIASNGRILFGAGKRRPGVEPHSGVYHRSVIFHCYVIAPNGDLVNRSRLLTRMSDNSR